jgi:pyruvate,water dikinase
MVARGGGLAASDRSVLTMTLFGTHPGLSWDVRRAMVDRHDVVRLDEVDPTDVALVGGKAAQLAALLRIDGVRVPEGACVTTAAYRRVVAASPLVEALVDGLSGLDPDDVGAIAARSAQVRRAIESVDVPGDLVAAIASAVEERGPDASFAVRSSATAEDTS